jgi:alpha-L-rhamnosidase
MNKRINRLTSFIFAALLSLPLATLNAAEVTDLRCEYLKAPLGIDVEKPRLSWKLETGNWKLETGNRKPETGSLKLETGNRKLERGIKQTSYQILVASSRDLLAKDQGDLWDSGKVESDQSVNVEYAGKPLTSGMRCFWKVRVWSLTSDLRLPAVAQRAKEGSPISSSWSEPSLWTMGLLNPAGWQGKWIKSDLELFDYQKELKKMPDILKEKSWPMWERSDRIREMTSVAKEAPAVWLRKAFSTPGKPLKKAVVRISGLGFYELYLNGKRVDDHYLNCAPYDFGKAVPYMVQEVTEFVSKGENVVGVILGNGHFNPVIPCALREYTADYIDTPRMLFDLQLEYADGSEQHVVSDGSWKFTTGGPIRFNSMRSGEIYDARMDLGDWSSNGYTTDSWKDALIAEPPTGTLVSQNLPPVRRIAEIPAVSVSKVDGKAHSVACTRLAEIPQVKDGAGYRFDLGVEATGWARLKLRGKPGQKILIRYPGSNIHTLGPYQECLYICKGDGEETYEPRFAFNGYRFVDVFGLDYEPKVSDVVGCLVVSDLRSMGRFSCSSPALNKIQEVVLRTILNYNIQMPMDPVREKSCWTQDIESNFKATACNFDVSRIYAKWQEDFIRSVQADGFVPTVVPSCFDGPEINGPWWGGMIVFNPWQLYNFYGDCRVLERSYEPMKHYMRYLDSIATNNIVSWGLGDWLDITAAGKHSKTCRPQNTTVPFTSTCAYMMYTDILRQTALLMNKPDEARGFATKVEAIRAAINSRFFNPATGVYDKGSQTGYTLALLLDLPPQAERMRVRENLKAQIVSDNYHITAGFVGIPFLLTYLTEHGMGDLAWKIATNPTYPGWFDMIFTLNNSVLKEDWAGKLVQMPSLASPIGEWFYRSLGGIRPSAPGFKSIIIQPYTETLDWVTCEYESPYGRIVSNWKREGGKLTMEVTIPANTTATVYIPAKDEAGVTESGKPAAKADGVKFLRMENGAAVYATRSGVYQFQSTEAKTLVDPGKAIRAVPAERM